MSGPQDLHQQIGDLLYPDLAPDVRRSLAKTRCYMLAYGMGPDLVVQKQVDAAIARAHHERIGGRRPRKSDDQ